MMIRVNEILKVLRYICLSCVIAIGFMTIIGTGGGGGGSGDGTTGDDSATLAITDVTLAEGNAGITAYVFDVTLTGTAASAFDVDFTTTDGTATVADSDYAAASGTLTFGGANPATQQITVNVNGDTTVEPDETFTVDLSFPVAPPAGVSFADNQGTGTLTNDDTPTSITMTQYFPLSSGWVTDNWTLAIDILDHDVDGVLTKAMFDTRHFPAAYYWTNDINGLRLHEIKRYDPMQPFEVQFSSPIKFADAECAVGSMQEGTRTACEDGSCFDFIYSIQFVDFEDITTPAGNFSNCAKFKMKFYPVGESPDDYGYETLWLGKNVGFVKAQSDINADFALFADKGETRQLISYHLTPSEMTQDEIDVRNAAKQAVSYFRQKDLTNFMAMIDDNFLDLWCRTKSLFEDDISNFWDNSTENWNFVSIEKVLFDGPDYAYVVREWTYSYKWIPDQSYESRWDRLRKLYKKQADGSWKVYGNQNQIYPDGLNVYVRRTPSQTTLAGGAYFRYCATDDYIQSPNDIPLLTITGPQGSSQTPPWDPDPTQPGFWGEVDISKAAKGYYTFEWKDKFGSSLLLTDYLSTTSVLPIPVLISPINNVALGSGTVDFQWEPVAGANGYRVEVYDVDTDDRVIKEYTNINAYTNPVPLPAGKSYRWRVRAYYYDEYGDMDSESRCDPENFSIN